VQNTALKAVESMQQILEQADHGASIAKDAGTAIASIQTETSRVVVAVEGIAKNLQQQEGDSEILLQTAAEVRHVANNNTEVAQLTVSAAAKMSALAKDMHQEVDAWKI
jgi:methyl-accepting chemotaxis protein